MDHTPRFESIDQFIRYGAIHKASVEITALAAKTRLSRTDRLALARLARRAFIPRVGLKLLRPLVRPSTKRFGPALPEEKIEYAACLSWVGALPECFVLLREVDHRRYPEAAFVTALAHFSQWNYREAIPFLEDYVQHPEVGEYWRLVGQVNLLAAHVHEQTAAPESLAQLERMTRERGHTLLLANVLQFKAEDAVNRKAWDEAHQAIHEAAALSDKDKRTDTLFLEKWIAVIALYQAPSRTNLQNLDAIRAKAREVQHWETLRDCDYHEVRATQDLKLATHLYFGTPYPAYRERLLRECPWLEAQLPTEYAWQLAGEAPAKKSIVAGEGLREGLTLHRLFFALTSDFYKPLNLGDLHAQVFPWKYFDPTRSADSLHQAIKRLRKHFEEQRLKLELREHQGEYSLSSAVSVAILIKPKTPEGARAYREILLKLKSKLKAESFSAPDASEVLGLSRNMVLVYLRRWQELGFIQKRGSGPKTNYAWTNKPIPD